VVGGTPFAAVARKHSQEPHASEGGYYDWVNPGSLASKPLDRAVFSIEVGKMSQPIEDEDGYHILRVMERKDAGQVSFQEAQPKIKEAIERQRQQAAQQEYLTKLRDQVKVWRIYDEPTEVASQPGETQQR
jgi:parvulin-like peptidyl-prolyl isomerase